MTVNEILIKAGLNPENISGKISLKTIMKYSEYPYLVRELRGYLTEKCGTCSLVQAQNVQKIVKSIA